MSAHIIEEKHTIFGKNNKFEEIISFYLIFRVFGHFYCDVVKRKCPCCLGCTKTQSPGISAVLHWQTPDVQIFVRVTFVTIVRNSYAHARNRLRMLTVLKSEAANSIILKLWKDTLPLTCKAVYGHWTVIQGQARFTKCRLLSGDTASSVKGVTTYSYKIL